MATEFKEFKNRIRNLVTLVHSVIDGGARAWEAERRHELSRLRFHDGRAVPRHIAVIMDGNGRWATRRGLPRSLGHRAGVEALRRVVRLCDRYHVPMLTVYAFSTENWGRPQEEVNALMNLLWETIRSDLEELHKNGVRLRHIGRLEGLSADVQAAIKRMMDLTRDNTAMELNVCFNYGGRAEIVDAVRAIVAAGLPQNQITEETITSHLYTRGLPDPDLIIRTGGEMRLSNYLVWQAAYAEYHSTPTLWPDFDHDDFVAALDAYAARKRRFGKTDEQLAPEASDAKAAEHTVEEQTSVEAEMASRPDGQAAEGSVSGRDADAESTNSHPEPAVKGVS